jgi:CubicO group peptidase (beta-lactamase class C family)
MANLESGVAVTPASVFHVASVSKQFTAMSILLLAHRGRLSLDDEARKYVTELPDYGRPLTIRHLLTRTSGLRDAFLLQGMAAPREDDADKNDTIVKYSRGSVRSIPVPAPNSNTTTVGMCC